MYSHCLEQSIASIKEFLRDPEIRVNHIIYLNFVFSFSLYVGTETRMGGKANLTKFLRDKLPCDQVIDLRFTDANSNEIAYCNTKQCTKTVNKNGNDPSLNWTNRFDETGGALVLTDIQKADNGREIRVKAHSAPHSGSGVGKVHLETIWILVNTFSGNHTFDMYRV